METLISELDLLSTFRVCGCDISWVFVFSKRFWRVEIDSSDVVGERLFGGLVVGLGVDASAAVSLDLAGFEEFGESGLFDLGFDFEVGVHKINGGL